MAKILQKENKDIQIGLRVTHSTKEALDNIANIENKRTTQVIADAITTFLAIYPTLKLIQTSKINQNLSLDARETGMDIIKAIQELV